MAVRPGCPRSRVRWLVGRVGLLVVWRARSMSCWPSPIPPQVIGGSPAQPGAGDKDDSTMTVLDWLVLYVMICVLPLLIRAVVYMVVKDDDDESP